MISLAPQHYQTSNVTSASPETLIVLLYSELFCCLARARGAAVKNDVAEKRKNTAKAIRILTGLMVSLNMDKGESVAWNLAVLYEHVARRLLRADSDATTAPFDEAFKLLMPLKEAWEAIAASPPTAPSPPAFLHFASVVA